MVTKFEPIKDSEPYYAVNTDKSVIKFNSIYDCCEMQPGFKLLHPLVHGKLQHQFLKRFIK